MNNTLVSILIPVYNRESIISDTIESALNQTYDNIEIIIVDNCSEDNTYQICREFQAKDSRVKVFKNQNNVGPVRNWIECLRKSNGEYVKFLWSDDWIDEDYIEKTIPYLSKSDIAFVYSAADIVFDDNTINSYKLFERDTVFDVSTFEKLSLFGGDVPVSPGCAIFRKEDVIKNLLIDIPNDDGLVFNRFGAGNDLLLFLLPLIDYTKIAFVSSTKSYFRAHKNSFSISNNLNLYYDWARQFYIEMRGDSTLEKQFKTVLLIKMIRDKSYVNIFKSNKNSISLNYLTFLILRKTKYKINDLLGGRK